MKFFMCSAFVCALEIFVSGMAWAKSGEACVCPEPNSMLLFIVGMIGIAGYASKRRPSKD